MGQGCEGEPTTSLSEMGKPDWCYDQPSHRGGSCRFSGHVERTHGFEAEQIRRRLASAVTDLLRWARENVSGETEEDHKNP